MTFQLKTSDTIIVETHNTLVSLLDILNIYHKTFDSLVSLKMELKTLIQSLPKDKMSWTVKQDRTVQELTKEIAELTKFIRQDVIR